MMQQVCRHGWQVARLRLTAPPGTLWRWVSIRPARLRGPTRPALAPRRPGANEAPCRNPRGTTLERLRLAAWMCALGSVALGSPGNANLPGLDPVLFIDNGKPVAVYSLAEPWQQKAGYLEGHGRSNELCAARSITHGDFHIKARLRMVNQKNSAAAFALDRNYFGFEGAKGTLYLNGRIFGGLRLLGPSPEVFERESWIDFEVVRAGEDLRFLINGRVAHRAKYRGKGFDRLIFSPVRSTMQISHFSVVGNTRELPPPLPRGYTIPLIDLAGEEHRQVVVDREPGQYLGHPTTVLLEDHRTMIAVYPKGHGRGAIVMKRSSDAGLTWSERLPTPKSWATSKEVPTIHRVIDKQGTKRLIMFSGLYPIRMAVSEDDGQTWSELEPIGDFGGIVAMGCLIRLKGGRYLAMFHDDGRFIGSRLKSEFPRGFNVYKTVSEDGGLTWSDPILVTRHDRAHLCEPGIIRSPDGNQLCVLLRENARRYNSFAIFSDDEGKTWTGPRELPAALTGDRHTGRYAPDGRLFISFRDRTHISATKGDWVGWVGTYEDVVKGREGQYRVRLMDNHRGADCAYPAVELLPDGTFVTTTYGHWVKGEKPFIVSVRFKLAEIDQAAARP